MFDMFKKGLGDAKFKAEQLIRVQGVQNEIGGLRQQISGLQSQIANTLMAVRGQQGPLSDPQLEALCAALDGINAQIAQKEAQIAAIQAETPPGAQQAPPPPPQQQYYPPQQQYTPPPAPAAPVAPAQPQGKTCPNCQALVPAGNKFCSNCGQPVS